jgi:hypothetical protein
LSKIGDRGRDAMRAERVPQWRPNCWSEGTLIAPVHHRDVPERLSVRADVSLWPAFLCTDNIYARPESVSSLVFRNGTGAAIDPLLYRSACDLNYRINRFQKPATISE